MVASCGGTSATPTLPGHTPPQAAKLTAKPWIYVANADYDSPTIAVYGRRANGDAAPLHTIAGVNTKLREPIGVAVDRGGSIYVADALGSNGYGSILVYAANADGNVAPAAKIDAGLDTPLGVALDSNGNVYVANNQGQSITVYAAKTYQLIRTIVGGNTRLYPVGLTLDASGKLYVVNFDEDGSGPGWVTVYPAGADGDVKPIQKIQGHRTGLEAPNGGIAVDGGGNLYVTDIAAPPAQGVFVFAPGANGDAKPIRTIAGPKTQLTDASGLALGAQGNAFVTNEGPASAASSVVVFEAHARGDVAPIREIDGAQTGLFGSAGIFVR